MNFNIFLNKFKRSLNEEERKRFENAGFEISHLAFLYEKAKEPKEKGFKELVFIDIEAIEAI